jgi:hypothetical protein
VIGWPEDAEFEMTCKSIDGTQSREEAPGAVRDTSRKRSPSTGWYWPAVDGRSRPKADALGFPRADNLSTVWTGLLELFFYAVGNSNLRASALRCYLATPMLFGRVECENKLDNGGKASAMSSYSERR